tara:strand:- start:145 stop:477 length:333 start_codon:yes stop_codon:yes gene_type:complete
MHVAGGAGAHSLLGDNLNLCIIDAGEVTGTGWLVLLWLESERVAVHTWIGAAAVVHGGLDLVKVLARLGLEAVLTVKHHLEATKRANKWTDTSEIGEITLLNPCALGGVS